MTPRVARKRAPRRRGAPGAALQSSDPLGKHWGFTGRFLDEETGLFYYRARYYDSTLGRFLQRDPLGYAPGPSLFEYSCSSPLSRTDSTGLNPKKELEKKLVAIRDSHQEELKDEVEKLTDAREAYGEAVGSAWWNVGGPALLGFVSGMKAGAKGGWISALCAGLFGGIIGGTGGLGAWTAGLEGASEDLAEAEDEYEQELKEEYDEMLKEMDEAVDTYNEETGDDATYPVHVDNAVTGERTWHKVGAAKE